MTLPFGLDPASTPVLGSYTDGEQKQASLTTQWYGLDRGGASEATGESGTGESGTAPILVITAAGRIRSVDSDGVVTYGQDVRVEYGRRDGTVLGSVTPIDIGPSPSWRNLRVPLDEIPPDAEAVRIVATDNDITRGSGSRSPRRGCLGCRRSTRSSGTRRPCCSTGRWGWRSPASARWTTTPASPRYPQWRILPDRVGADATNAWQDDIGGGPLGWTELLLRAETLATYLNHDWARDWGSLEQFTPFDQAAIPGTVTLDTVTRSGLWSPEPMRVD